MLLYIVGTFVVTLLAGTWWWIDANRLPTISPPTPVLPVPNAYDDCMKAASAIKVTPVLIETKMALEHGVPLRSIPLRSSPTPAAAGPVPVPGSYWPPLPSMQAEVAANAPALATLRAGFANEYCEPKPYSVPFRQHSNYTDIAHLLVADGIVKAAHGRWGDAVSADLDAIQFGVMVMKGAPYSRGLQCQQMGRYALWNFLPHLSAKEARTATHRMEGICARQVPCADMLTLRKWSALTSMIALFRKPGGAKTLASHITGTPNPSWRQRLPYSIVSKPHALRTTRAYMDALITRAKMPYAASAPIPPSPDEEISWHFVAGDSTNLFRFTLNETQNPLLLTTLALHSYRKEHGADAPSLSALVPGYLSAVPNDPFALHGPLHYKVVTGNGIVYSIGPDGIDDGGTPSIDGQRKPGAHSIGLSAGSRGDIVAGVNVR